ncbi:MAG TPA: 2-octaprenyl-6-methoxyphenyl hydroxylase [Xanthomonadaceae bacterium]|nr:2-octaprenyl-6-methoxyphenyl hydroxylase [Xanthomonadaceae bacterium]
MTNSIHDVLIIGGGLVGASLACALDGSGLDVALVESEPPRVSVIPDSDARSLALAAASLNALGALAVLRHMPTQPAPIKRIHVSRRGDFGAVSMRAEDYGRDAFGGVVPAPSLGVALQARLTELEGFSHYVGARLVALRGAGDVCEADIVCDGATTTLRTRLLVGADGTASFVRKALGIGASGHDYAQHLFAGSVRAARAADGQAWERFTDDGPMAMLPQASGGYGCICTVPSADADEVAALDDAGFIALLQERFGWRAGRFLAVGRRVGYPLRQLVAERLTAPRAVIMGNAAQTLHPIGAQGFNLGLRDALTLAELVRDTGTHGGDLGGSALLDAYAQRRAEDREQTLRFSDGLARITSNPALPVRLLRSFAMSAFAAIPDLRATLVGGAMGFRGVVPALARDVFEEAKSRYSVRPSTNSG